MWCPHIPPHLSYTADEPGSWCGELQQRFGVRLLLLLQRPLVQHQLQQGTCVCAQDDGPVHNRRVSHQGNPTQPCAQIG